MRAFFALLAAVALIGCDSDSDTACHDVGNCSHGGSDDWITACSDQADTLADEAHAVGCQAAFDAYFSCADDRFECTGNKSSFPGCEAKLDAYSACLAAKESGTACIALEDELAACDPRESAHDQVPTPCTASGDCSARCYLDSLADVCAPTAAELSAFADCASHCVF
jgi:hypothetical protein